MVRDWAPELSLCRDEAGRVGGGPACHSLTCRQALWPLGVCLTSLSGRGSHALEGESQPSTLPPTGPPSLDSRQRPRQRPFGGDTGETSTGTLFIPRVQRDPCTLRPNAGGYTPGCTAMKQATL